MKPSLNKLLVFLTVFLTLAAHQSFAGDVGKELKYLGKTYKWFAVIETRENQTHIRWICEPPEKFVTFLEKLIPIEVEISKRNKSRKFLYCVASNGIATASYQVHENSIRIQGESLRLAAVEKYLNEASSD